MDLKIKKPVQYIYTIGLRVYYKTFFSEGIFSLVLLQVSIVNVSVNLQVVNHPSRVDMQLLNEHVSFSF